VLAQITDATLTHADVRRNSLSAPTLEGAYVDLKKMRSLLLAILAIKSNPVFESYSLAHLLALLTHKSLQDQKW